MCDTTIRILLSSPSRVGVGAEPNHIATMKHSLRPLVLDNNMEQIKINPIADVSNRVI